MRELLGSRVAWAVYMLAGVGGFVAMLVGLLDAVRSGKGLNTYRSFWGVEWNPLVVLILIIVATLVLVVGGALSSYAEEREERDFLATMRERLARRKQERGAGKRRGLSNRGHS
jgi:hypothetical protein